MKLDTNFKEIPYWLDPPVIAKSYSVNPLPARTEVLVIGGGYTGTTAAIRLKLSGIQVTLIDMEKMGTTASARNGGMTLTGLSGKLTAIEKKFGKEKASRLFAESVESVNAVERIVSEFSIACDFHRHGHLVAAFKPSHFESLKKEQERLNSRFNHTTHIIPAADLKSDIGSAFYHGALLDPQSAGVHPAKYIAGLISVADQLGVDLHELTTAETIERRGTAFSVSTNRGAIKADEIIVATNGYTGSLTPWIQRRLIPTESLMIATEELPAAVAKSLIPKGRMVYDTKIFLFYFRLSPDGRRLLFGGRPKSPQRPIGENAAYMYRDLLRVYPALKDVGIDYAWSGKLGFTLDRCPHLGRHNGQYFALGYCGHGVAMATYLGEKVAAMVQGRETNTAFSELSFRAVPFYNGRPWFRPAVYLYFSMLDRFF